MMASISDLQQQLADFSTSKMTALFVMGLAAMGAAAVLRIVLGAVRAAWVFFLRPGRNLKKLGTWAVVTGATDGIGKAYAEALARKGGRRDLRHAGYSQRLRRESKHRLLLRLARPGMTFAANYSHCRTR